MAYVVTEPCINCKYTNCAAVCPVDAFREGPNFLTIDPLECIDCDACVPECPVEAIYPDSRREVLTKINWRHNWHTTHIYADHVQPLLPKGTVLIFTSFYDNTVNNPSNPDPDQWVPFARRSANEMSHIRIGMTYFDDEQFARLEEERAALLEARAGGRPTMD